MVMDQFVTTYRKDYLWPYVKTIGIKPGPDALFQPQLRDKNLNICPCHCLKDVPPLTEQKGVLGPNALQDQQWSRQGPMGPLLDPKLYPARVGASPEAESQRFNQPNVFLKKLQEKYPFIYEVLRTAPPDDMISRINKDRLRTTYQVDYCNLKEYPSAPYDELLRSAGVGGLAACPEPVRLPGDPCRPNQRPLAFRPTTLKSLKGGKGSGCGGGIKGVPPGATEYQDVIGKLGIVIIRDKIHATPRPGKFAK